MKQIVLITTAILLTLTAVPLGLAETIDDAVSYVKEGDRLFQESDFEAALENFTKALTIFTALDQKKGEGVCLAYIGVIYRYMGRYDDAITYSTKALKKREEIGNRKGQAEDLNNLGTAYWSLCRYDEALSFFTDALALSREVGYRMLEAAVLNNTGAVYFERGVYDRALSYFTDALTIRMAIGDDRGTATTLGNIGGVYHNRGRYEEALSRFTEALEIQKRTGNREGQISSLNNIGVSHLYLGRYERAVSFYERALALSREIGDRPSEALALGNIGVAYKYLDQYEKALAYFEQSRAIKTKIGDRNGESADLNNIGVVYLESDRPKRARPYLADALAIRRDIGEKRGLGETLLNLGYVSLDLGRGKEALSYFEEALCIESEIGYQEGIYLCAFGLGTSYRELGQDERALSCYREAVDALESMRAGLTTEVHKTGYTRDRMEVYEDLIDLLIEMGRDEEAFNYMERARSRAFLDLLGTKELAVRGDRNGALLEEERRLKSMIAGLRERGAQNEAEGDGPHTRAIAETLRGDIETLEAGYDDLLEKIRRQDPELGSLVAVDPITLPRLQEMLPDDVHCLEFFTTDDATFVFSVSRGSIAVFRVKIKRDDLSSQIDDLRAGIYSSITKGDDADFRGRSRELFGLLLLPALEGVTAERLVIIPHGPIHYLPFSALYDGSRYLVDSYTIVVDPSASVLEYLSAKRKDASGNMLALGNPTTRYSPLPYAEKEVAEITAIMGDVTMLVGGAATETRGKESFSRYRVIHLACHGKFWEDNPLSSAIYLADDGTNDGALTVSELFALDLTKTSLVVLSACETGLAQVMSGDELIGLSRGFIYAGTPSLVVTLWEVADDSTAQLMAEFYRGLKEGLDKPEALRMAQTRLLTDEKYNHPFYWAPFVIMGDWR